MDEVKFDEVNENTNLAEEYLKKNATFKSKGFPDSDRFSLNDHKNTIYYTSYTRISGTVILRNDVSDIPAKLKKLAKKIEENAELFCQLELLLRKIPMEDTKNIDLKLIIQNFNYHSSSQSLKGATSTARQMIFDSVTPLAALGYVGQVLLSHMPRVVIESTRETAAVATLFTELCHQVGLEEKVLLVILPEALENRAGVTVDVNTMAEFQSGCVGIVSGKSDVDSAVDCFLSTSTRYPWTLKKIFVQENAVEKFTTTMTWKEEKLMEKKVTKNKSEVNREMSYNFGDKMFTMKINDKNEHDGNVIILEAYRTVKELLSLLEKEKPFAISLWCSDLAETNEIAHNVDVNIVWVNDLANFEGAPRSSQAFYSLIDMYFCTDKTQYLPEMAELSKIRDSWLEIGIDKRLEVVRNALVKIDKNQAKSMLHKLDNITIEMDTFVNISNNIITTGVELQPQVMYPSSMYGNDLDLSIISYIIKGGTILLFIPPRILAFKSKDISYMFYENLRSMGGAVLFLQDDCRYGDIPVLRYPIDRIKVVWTNFGTIFAN